MFPASERSGIGSYGCIEVENLGASSLYPTFALPYQRAELLERIQVYSLTHSGLAIRIKIWDWRAVWRP